MCYRISTQFQEPRLNIAHTSPVRALAVLLLTVRKKKRYVVGGGFLWHNVHTKFCEKSVSWFKSSNYTHTYIHKAW
jgi:hypothetical protein